MHEHGTWITSRWKFGTEKKTPPTTSHQHTVVIATSIATRRRAEPTYALLVNPSTTRGLRSLLYTSPSHLVFSRLFALSSISSPRLLQHSHTRTTRPPPSSSFSLPHAIQPPLHHGFSSPEHWHQGHRDLLPQPGSFVLCRDPPDPKVTSASVFCPLLPALVDAKFVPLTRLCQFTSMSSNPSLRSSTVSAPASTPLVSARPR